VNEDQKRRVADAPPAYRGIIRRAYDPRAVSWTNAIRAFCLQCTGYVRKDIRDCTAPACPLWAYRPYQTDDEPEEGPELVAGPAATGLPAPQNASGEVPS